MMNSSIGLIERFRILFYERPYYVRTVGHHPLFNNLNFWVIFGVVLGISIGLTLGLISGLKGSELEVKTNPNQGIWRSARNSSAIGILSGLFFGFISGSIFGLFFGTFGGLTFGLISGLIIGGATCIQHFVLRFNLYRMGYIPWNYARFLDYATDRLFLQKVGGGYIFVHRMLLEHFAAMPLEQEKR
jgi:hypothetical protein